MNRIKQLRQERQLSQRKLGEIINASNQAVSAYQSGIRNPKEETWKALADFFGVSVPYLQGAYSEDEIIKIAQTTYKDRFYNSGSYQTSILNDMRRIDTFTYLCDDLFIYTGSVPYNVKKEEAILSVKQVENFEFWKNEIKGFFISSVAMKWLINKPYLNASRDDVIDLLIDVISAQLAHNPFFIGEEQELGEDRLKKRKNFIEQYTFVKSDKESKAEYAYVDFKRQPHPLDGKEYR